MRYRDKPGYIICFLLGGFLLFQTSCVTQWPRLVAPDQDVSGEKSTGPIVFRSKEYIVCRLGDGETPADLAEKFLGDRKKSWMIEDANEGISFKKGKMIVIPLKRRNLRALTPDGYQVVPVLSYHHFAEDCTSIFCMSADAFEKQMRYLKDHGFRVITMRELLRFLQHQRALPKRAVAITIDDGYRSAYEIAYPILKRYGFTATLFIYTDFVGVSGKAITWDQLREMKASGFEIASHTASHIDLGKKRKGEDDEAYLARIKNELLVSKQILDEKLKQNTLYLAYPYGRYNQKVLAVADEVGFKLAFSARRGGNPFFADPLNLNRTQVLKRNMENFTYRLKTFHEYPLQ